MVEIKGMRLFRSFYARLSSIFLLLILALGAASIGIAFNAAGLLFDEVEQLLNREYAASIAEELNGLVGDGSAEGAVEQAIHYMMVLNPMVEIYLLSGEGEVVSYFTHPDEGLERFFIDLDPVRRFISGAPDELILGDDPRGGAGKKPFSAAPYRLGSEQGFVYVILRGNSYDRSLEALRNSYYLRTGLLTFLIATLATLVAGLSIFFFLTRKLRRLSVAVTAFKLGEMELRAPSAGSDEIGDLGRAFNEMAESIKSGVEKLRFAEQQRSELIANISHDLRSPLTSIRGALETVLLKDPQLNSDERKELLDVSLRNVSSFQKLVEDLFQLIRLETKQEAPNREPFLLAEIAQDVVLKLKPRATEAHVDLQLEMEPELPLVDADIGMIERTFTNLIENSLRFTPPGGDVRISLERRGEYIEVTVSDTGTGIPPDDLPHIFERFYRADKSRNRKVPGTGLGLAIAREIVELHGGSIRADSTADSGTRISFTLRI